MGAAHFVLIINICVATAFAAAYVAIAMMLPSQRKALWFAVACCVGVLKPVSDLLLAEVPFPAIADCIGYAGFLASLVLMSVAFRLFHGQRAQWGVAAGVVVGGLILRIVLFSWDRTSLAHGIAYQLPFAAAALLGCLTAWRAPEPGRLHGLLAAMFAVMAMQFAAKPWIATSVGAGRTLGDYLTSRYALISQSITGVLLMAAGLTLLLLIAHRAVQQSARLAETDPLCGLLNRRGFEWRADALLARSPAALLMIDLDHFKRINDHHGHITGDRVLQNFARVLADLAPAGALAARLGGEEFVLLMPGSIEAGMTLAEKVRRAACVPVPGLPMITASVGVAAKPAGAAFGSLMRGADAAVYSAKNAGRDRVATMPVLREAA